MPTLKNRESFQRSVDLFPDGMDSSTKLTILISGNGTNLQAVIDKIDAQQLPATIVRVISNRKNAYGLERAKRAGIPTTYHNLLMYKKNHPPTDQGIRDARKEYDTELAKLVLQDGPALVVCLGFLHVLSRSFLDPIDNARIRLINLHPALPGAFSGSVSISLIISSIRELSCICVLTRSDFYRTRLSAHTRLGWRAASAARVL